MNGSRRLFLGVVIAALTLTVFGCFTSSQLNSENFAGQGGGTTSATTTATTTTSTTTATSSSTGGGVPCSLPALPCADDGNPCTVEACTNGFCTVAPLDIVMGPGSNECITIDCVKGDPTKTIHDGKSCGDKGKLNCIGEICSGCKDDAACGAADACQTPTCLSDKTCDYGYKPIGTPVAPALPTDMKGDCMATICNGSGKVVLFVDDTDVPADLLCNDGHCVNGKQVQTPLIIGTACAGGKTFCDANQECVECATDANCTTLGATCYQQSGCVSCTDDVKNGDETDVDCGGACGACADKLACVLPKDCKSTMCESGTCISCKDDVKNGGEASIDCGGTSTCLACPGTACSVAAQCALGFCDDAVCCDKACTAPCKSCNLGGKAGQCSSSPVGLGDPACPAATPVCQAGLCVDDMGKKHLGDSCMGNSDCFSVNCQGPMGAKICQ